MYVQKAIFLVYTKIAGEAKELRLNYIYCTAAILLDDFKIARCCDWNYAFGLAQLKEIKTERRQSDVHESCLTISQLIIASHL